MIVIVGTQRDDILYFESIISGKKNRLLFDRFPIVEGHIFNQEVLLVYGMYSSYVSSAVMMDILSKNFVNLIIVVGKCTGFSKDVKVGDIVISHEVIIGDVDQVSNADTTLGQIPGFPKVYQTGNDLINYIETACQKRAINKYKIGTFISSNTIYNHRESLEKLTYDDGIFGFKNNVVLDSISGGIVVNSAINKVPFINIKVVDKLLDKEYDVENYLTVLDSYVNVGKAVTTMIGDIGRKDVLRSKQ